MIFDNIKNAALYETVHPGFSAAFAFLREDAVKPMPFGTYELDGQDVYAMVQTYDTGDDESCKMETHDKYIDIQYVANGSETIGCGVRNELVATQPYSAEKDCTLYEPITETLLRLNSGDFAVLFPQDAHRPRMIWKKPMTIRKIVVKVKML